MQNDCNILQSTSRYTFLSDSPVDKFPSRGRTMPRGYKTFFNCTTVGQASDSSDVNL